ncbi:MAG TPA: hypothetical protein VK618_08525 [Flavitalea sp.]|nr:hypothetical protein [Flavitalea sp.]
METEVNPILKPQDIRGFGVDGYDDYLSATVSYHLNPISPADAPDQFSDSTETRTGFLRLISDGKYKLYQLVLPKRMYYFVQVDQNELLELIYRVKKVQMILEEDKRYRNTLFDLFSTEDLAAANVKTIINASYNEGDLSKLVKLLNKNNSKAVKKNKSSGQFELDLLGSIGRQLFPDRIQGVHIPSARMTSTTVSAVGINGMYFFPGRFRPLAIGLSLGYHASHQSMSLHDTIEVRRSSAWYYQAKRDEEITVNGNAFQSNIYALYFLNPLSRYKIFLKGGLNINHLVSRDYGLNSSFSTESNGMRNAYTPYSDSESGESVSPSSRRTYYMVNVGLGLSTGKHKIEMKYDFPSFIDLPAHVFRTSSLMLNYYFTVLN